MADIDVEAQGQGAHDEEGMKKAAPAVMDAKPQQATTVDDEAIARQLQQEEVNRVQTIDQFERSIRHGFIRKVFGILFLQVLVMMGVVSIFMYVPPVQRYVKENVWVLLLCAAFLIASIISLSCCGDIHKRFPYNLYLLLSIAVLAGGLFGTIAARVENFEYVWTCFGATAAVMLCLGLFALQEHWDFSGAAPFVCVGAIVIIAFALLGAMRGLVGYVFVAAIVLFFAMYVVYDVQLVIGGKHKRYQFGVDDYALAALTLYTDFLVIFWVILACGGANQ